jgi:hypothetical protein
MAPGRAPPTVNLQHATSVSTRIQQIDRETLITAY